MKKSIFLMSLLALVLTVSLCMMCSVSALAAEPAHEGQHGSQTQAQVSAETDSASEKDNAMATSFFMYIEPDNITHSTVPDMGDEGMDPVQLLGLTFCVGLCYLGCSAYANKKEDS